MRIANTLSFIFIIAVCSASGACKSNYLEPAPKNEAKDFTRELPPGMKGLRKIDPSKYPDFGPGLEDRDGMLQALAASAEYLSHASSQNYFPYLDISHDRAEATIQAFRKDLTSAASGSDLNKRIRDRYEVYESVGWNMEGEMLFTAYHEPIYEGSLKADAKFKYPIYKRPPELESDETGEKAFWKEASGNRRAAPARAELAAALRGRGLELIYLSDPFESYIVQVQGSARFHLPDGREIRVGYAGDNGQDYKPVWEPLVKSGKLKKEEVSLRRLREYFKQHPDDVEQSINYNPRFVFFQERTGPAVGCLNVPVTLWHTIATDRNRKEDIFPRAGIAYIKTKLSKSPGAAQSDYAGFVCDQDRGGAIRSAGRADLFLGTGEVAEQLAGQTRAEGRMYYVFLKDPLVAAEIGELGAQQQKAQQQRPSAKK
ncbi:MAG: MltA domain-containing protein [Planctomycetes bacterium]|nr:MltA domain-containing protein [Planctomycetota bacterium]